MSVYGSLLFVDDTELWLQALQRALATLRPSWRCRWASSAEEAMSLLAAERVDIVVTDYDLGPGMNGEEFLAKVQQRYPATKRVMISTRPVAKGRVAEVVLTKLVGIKVLFAELDALVDQVQ